MSDTPSTPAGWYDDGSGRRRYWDGAAWTDHFETPAATTPEAPTQAYGAPTDSYGTAPTQAYGATDPAASAPAATPYGAEAPYGAAPAYAPPAGYAAPGSATPSGYAAPAAYGSPAPYGAPGSYGAPAGYGGGRVPSPADGKPSILGLVALGVGALALVLAFVPAINVASFGLAPIAIVLAIVAFFLRGKKWPAIAGIIVGVVALIAAVVMFFVYAFIAANQFISTLPDLPDGTSTVAPPSDDGSATPDDSGTDTGDGGVGSSADNPAPIGSTITGSEYTVVINSVTLDADDQILAVEGNPPADDGLSYALINATVTYTGTEASGSGFFISIGYEGADGTTYSYGDNDAFPPDPDIYLVDLPAGQAVTGNTVLAIPVDADGVITVSPGLLDDVVYVALR